MHKKQIKYTRSFTIPLILSTVFLFCLSSINSYAASYSSITESDTALHIAAQEEDIELVQALLNKPGVKGKYQKQRKCYCPAFKRTSMSFKHVKNISSE